MRPCAPQAQKSHAPTQLRTIGKSAGTHLSQAKEIRKHAGQHSRRDFSTSRSFGPKLQDEEGVLSTGLTFREIDPKVVRSWVMFQLLALVFQWLLWSEVRVHLDLFDRTLAAQCLPEHVKHGVCLGPMWNLSSWEETILEGQRRPERFIGGRYRHRHWRGKSESLDDVDRDIKAVEDETAQELKELKQRKQELQMTSISLHRSDLNDEPPSNASHSFDFSTRSEPPTFLVVVDPASRSRAPGEPPPKSKAELSEQELEALAGARWSLKVARIDPAQAKPMFEQEHSGTSVMSFEDLSPESQQTLKAKGRVQWRATLVNHQYTDRRTRFVTFVEDSAVPHLGEIHSNSQCSFIRSWKAFNQQSQGHSHETLAWCVFLLGVFLPLSAIAIFIVHRCAAYPEFGSVGCCEGYGFHAFVLAKFFVMDVPQQICIVLYLFGWYESEGLRCQLCLFHPWHCEEEHPFRLTNSAAFTCTLLSSVANQLLFRPALRRPSYRHNPEEDVCMQHTSRLAAACVSTLPFTTGVFLASSALLSAPLLAQVVMFFPCAVGWMTVAVLALCLLHNCCEDCSA